VGTGLSMEVGANWGGALFSLLVVCSVWSVKSRISHILFMCGLEESQGPERRQW
jgi:hypothetical protein